MKTPPLWSMISINEARSFSALLESPKGLDILEWFNDSMADRFIYLLAFVGLYFLFLGSFACMLFGSLGLDSSEPLHKEATSKNTSQDRPQAQNRKHSVILSMAWLKRFVGMKRLTSVRSIGSGLCGGAVPGLNWSGYNMEVCNGRRRLRGNTFFEQREVELLQIPNNLVSSKRDSTKHRCRNLQKLKWNFRNHFQPTKHLPTNPKRSYQRALS